MENEPSQSAGVQELIDRLRETGVEEGRARAEELFLETNRQAEQRLAEARRQAEEILQAAQKEAARTRDAGEQAVRLAVRDAILALKDEIVEHFSRQVRRLVSHSLEDEEFIKELIREVARRALPLERRPGQEKQETGGVEVLLPRDFAPLEELRRQPEEVLEGTLSHFVQSLARHMFKDGIVFRPSDDDAAGIRVRLLEDDVEVDLTDKAVSDLLLRHLLPRFRVMMEGVVR